MTPLPKNTKLISAPCLPRGAWAEAEYEGGDLWRAIIHIGKLSIEMDALEKEDWELGQPYFCAMLDDATYLYGGIMYKNGLFHPSGASDKIFEKYAPAIDWITKNHKSLCLQNLNI
jgi:hypothetical protein